MAMGAITNLEARVDNPEGRTQAPADEMGLVEDARMVGY